MSNSRRSRSNSVKKNPRTFKSGRVTRNPFLNFLRDFRRSNCGLKLTELTRRGAEVWRKMNDRQRSPYCHLARQAPRRRNRRRRKSRGRSKKRRRSQKRRTVSRDPPREDDHHRKYEQTERRYDRDKDRGRCEEVEIRGGGPEKPDNDQNSVEIID